MGKSEKQRTTIDERFWPKVDIHGPDDCWSWLASRRTGSDYGQFVDTYIENGKRVQKFYAAHRLSWILTHGPIPDRLCVLHRCDNPLCVNPSHLFLGTNKDNVDDMKKKGRDRRTLGLEPRDYVDIKRRADAGEPLDDIAREYGLLIYRVYEIQKMVKKRYRKIIEEFENAARNRKVSEFIRHSPVSVEESV